MTLPEIEELIKTVNRSAIKAMLRNAAILGDEKATPEMKAQALENVKAISANKQRPKKSKAKATAAPSTQLAQQPIPSPLPATEAPKIEYPEGLHLTPLNTLGHDETKMKSIFDALPDHEKKNVVDWHSKVKVQKSVDALYHLFAELKKHL